MVNDDDGASRRALLRGAGAVLAGVGGVVLAGCGGQKSTATTTQPVKDSPPAVLDSDVRILNRALELERRTVAAYVAGVPLLDHKQAKTAKQFLNEELEHTGELISLIKAAGSKAPPKADSYDIGRARDAAGVLTVLHTLERMQIAYYLDAIPRLSPAGVRASVATILNSDSQHIAVLRLGQGMPAVPSPFVTGAE
ncbi:MAG: ferritin-like domain-containing protein [Solirubrobacteraceae bacterium]